MTHLYDPSRCHCGGQVGIGKKEVADDWIRFTIGLIKRSRLFLKPEEEGGLGRWETEG